MRRRDAHAWPEVYFPSLGWIEFEPTASQSPINRPLGGDESDTAAGNSSSLGGGGTGESMDDKLARLLAAEEEGFGEFGSSAAAPGFGQAWVSWVVMLLALGVILIAFVRRARRQRGSPPLFITVEASIRRMGLQPPMALRVRARRAASSPLTRAYLELNYALARLDAPPAPADTPAERAIALTRLLPIAEGPAQQLLDEYQATAYGPRPGSLYAAQQAARTIRSLSWRARIRRLISRYAPGNLSL